MDPRLQQVKAGVEVAREHLVLVVSILPDVVTGALTVCSHFVYDLIDHGSTLLCYSIYRREVTHSVRVITLTLFCIY